VIVLIRQTIRVKRATGFYRRFKIPAAAPMVQSFAGLFPGVNFPLVIVSVLILCIDRSFGIFIWILISVLIYWMGHVGIYKFGVQDDAKKIRRYRWNTQACTYMKSKKTNM